MTRNQAFRKLEQANEQMMRTERAMIAEFNRQNEQQRRTRRVQSDAAQKRAIKVADAYHAACTEYYRVAEIVARFS